MRYAVMKVVGNIPAIGEKLATIVEEIGVGYQDSPAVLERRPRHADVVAGQHLPHVADPELQKQLSLACGAANPGHTILTVAAGPAPAAGPAGQTQVLIAPDGLVAKRYGLRDGGRVVVRPDGYIGAVVALDDQRGVADYFAAIAR